MTPVGIGGGPILRVPRASFSGMRDHQRPQQQQQQQQHSSFSPYWPPRDNINNSYNNNGSGTASASAVRRGSVGGSYGYGYGNGRSSIGGVGGGSSRHLYDRFNGRDEQDLEIQEDEVDASYGESYVRRSQEFEAGKVS
jgi:hypothetical protein